MKSILRLFTIISLLAVFSSCCEKAQTLSVVPYPQDVVIENGCFDAFGACTLSKGLTDEETAVVEKFGLLIKEASGGAEKSVDVVFSRDESLAPEEYVIEIGCRKVKVYSASYNGTLYAVMTLMQLMPDGV